VEFKYLELNVTEYLARRIFENDYSYMTLSKGYSRNNVYDTCRNLIGNSKLTSVWTNCEESLLNPQPLIRMSLKSFGM